MALSLLPGSWELNNLEETLALFIHMAMSDDKDEADLGHRYATLLIESGADLMDLLSGSNFIRNFRDHMSLGLARTSFILDHWDVVNSHFTSIRRMRTGTSQLEVWPGAGDIEELGEFDIRGWTPLLVACHDGYLDLVRLLLERGAKTDVLTPDGKTPMDLLKDAGCDPEANTPEDSPDYRPRNVAEWPFVNQNNVKTVWEAIARLLTTPRSLGEICRQAIRNRIGVAGIANLTEEDLPRRLLDYLSYKREIYTKI